MNGVSPSCFAGPHGSSPSTACEPYRGLHRARQPASVQCAYRAAGIAGPASRQDDGDVPGRGRLDRDLPTQVAGHAQVPLRHGHPPTMLKPDPATAESDPDEGRQEPDPGGRPGEEERDPECRRETRQVWVPDRPPGTGVIGPRGSTDNAEPSPILSGLFGAAPKTRHRPPGSRPDSWRQLPPMP